MAFQKIGDEVLDAKIAVRLTAEEKQRLAEDADIAGLSMSALVRARYFGRKVVANADLVMIKHLNRLTGMLKTVHNESNGEYSADTAAAILLVSEAIKKISRSS
uniref:Putative conjugal transfer relaxosome component TraJ n=1 Tax=Polaromonas sp. W10N TaxID=1840301 RepID=A0A2S1FIX9_9BURK|nr:MobB mobilization protein [Polaromonas sp. W10N]AWD72319.1 putative conjugal transfer relaxosome component TraJ [Polaromonas sp. W10N]